MTALQIVVGLTATLIIVDILRGVWGSFSPSLKKEARVDRARRKIASKVNNFSNRILNLLNKESELHGFKVSDLRNSNDLIQIESLATDVWGACMSISVYSSEEYHNGTIYVFGLITNRNGASDAWENRFDLSDTGYFYARDYIVNFMKKHVSMVA